MAERFNAAVLKTVYLIGTFVRIKLIPNIWYNIQYYYLTIKLNTSYILVYVISILFCVFALEHLYKNTTATLKYLTFQNFYPRFWCLRLRLCLRLCLCLCLCLCLSRKANSSNNKYIIILLYVFSFKVLGLLLSTILFLFLSTLYPL